MPPIPVHIDDPIVPQKADGITPHTSQLQQPPAANNAITTAAPSQAYPPARPGAAAAPAPTPYIAPPPLQPTRTSQTAQDGPPPPQPGAVPIPPSQQVAASALPPPPKPGEAAKAREESVTQMPPQMSMPAPTTNYVPTHSTSTLPPAPIGGATTINLGPVTSPAAPAGVPTAPHQPPEGYRQDTNAQEMSAAQRSSLEEQERKQSVFSNVSLGGNGDISGDGPSVGETAASAWSAVKGFVGAAGEKLVGAEEEVWNRINGR